MDDLRLEGVAVYNPRLLSRDELCGNFCVREDLLERLVDDLRRACPNGAFPHRLILGQRGMGKTTLLHRVRFAIEDDEDLSKIWFPLVFPEEQYNIADLSGLWLNCLDAVADGLESRGEDIRRIDETIDRLAEVPKARRAEAALAALRDEAARLERRLVLLIDNVDMVLDRIDAEQWTLRKVLSEGNIALIGASSYASETTYQYGKAFYDFFAVEELGGLSLAETRRLLIRLAERADKPDVRMLVEQHPERIEPMRILTGGNPRTIVLLFTVHAQGVTGTVRSDLDKLLDLCTPLYKHRFESLSTQAQQIVAGLCMNWHPIGSRDLAARLDLKSTTVSGQLERLFKD
ncbi:MAG: ATP-binding protein, partial [Myxococcota bacterium]